ncbi:MAG: FAD-dependent oxidoreductase, partial [Gemmatimonadaceae bacterium]|nr:FAD-dependent oxidoreductase [Gemmatimonadaceae bacterium]
PSLATAPVTSIWAGLRPVTPDMLPLLGPDPANPSLIYACGHSRNGILLAPLTGEVVASLVEGTPVNHDLTQFRPGRF